MPACSSNFRSDHRERIKLPDGGNRQRELAKPSETKILFLCKCPLEIKLGGKSKRREVTSVASSQVFFSPEFPGRRERVA